MELFRRNSLFESVSYYPFLVDVKGAFSHLQEETINISGKQELVQ